MRRALSRPSLPIGLVLGLVLAFVGALVPSTSATAVPRTSRQVLVSGLSYPWDLTWVGGTMLYTLRGGTIWSKQGTAAPRQVKVALPKIRVASEGGLLGIVADPKVTTDFYTCAGVLSSGGDPLDVRVQRWRLTSPTSAVAVNLAATGSNAVVTGLPIGSGRHNGCRLRFGADDKLYVGTGDAAQGTNPQNLNSLGGKVLRVNRDGTAPSDNPFYGRGGNARYVWTYGHRNVQGLALRPGTSQMWSVEHGSSVDDEVNLNVKGANYGWDPVPGYNESVPMTDLTKFPNAVPAVWRSGNPTIAPSGGTFLTGDAWGRWQGALAIGVLKGQGIKILSLNPNGGLASQEWLTIAGRDQRIRAVQQGPDGALYYTTSLGGGKDQIVKITPAPLRTLPTYRLGQDVSPVGVAAARDGSTFWLAIRTTGNRVFLRRSGDDARTWGGWIDTGINSTSAPSLASPSSGRLDLVTRGSTGNVLHTVFDGNGRRTSQDNLGGYVTAAPTVSSVGDGTVDVFVRGRADGAARNHYAGGRWSGWVQLGGVFSSAITASADHKTRLTTLAGRDTGGAGDELVVTPTGNGTGWSIKQARIWSARALGDTYGAGTKVGVTSGSDLNTVVDRGALVQGIGVPCTSAPAVVSRPDGTFAMFGRSLNGTVFLYDARPGGYRNVSLGGSVI